LLAVAAHAEIPELERAVALFKDGKAQEALAALALVPPGAPVADRARAQLYTALAQAQRGDSAAAHAAFVAAFLLDPELPLPEGLPADTQSLATIARFDAQGALKARLREAAAAMQRAFTTPPPGPTPVATAPATGLSPAKAPPDEATEAPPPPAAPTLLGTHLGAGVHGYYILTDNRLGPSFEVSGGLRLGPLWLGGVVSLMLGDALAGTLAARLSTISDSRVAYLAALDVGGFYGGTHAQWVPFVTFHAAGVHVRIASVILDIHAVSVGIFYVNGVFRFAPQAGVVVLL
jgi:hypothetical protein